MTGLPQAGQALFVAGSVEHVTEGEVYGAVLGKVVAVGVFRLQGYEAHLRAKVQLKVPVLVAYLHVGSRVEPLEIEIFAAEQVVARALVLGMARHGVCRIKADGKLQERLVACGQLEEEVDRHLEAVHAQGGVVAVAFVPRSLTAFHHEAQPRLQAVLRVVEGNLHAALHRCPGHAARAVAVFAHKGAYRQAAAQVGLNLAVK